MTPQRTRLALITCTALIALLTPSMGCGDDSDLDQLATTPTELVGSEPTVREAPSISSDEHDPQETLLLYRRQRRGPDSCRFLTERAQAQFRAVGANGCDAYSFLYYGTQEDTIVTLEEAAVLARLRIPCEATYTMVRDGPKAEWAIDHVQDQTRDPYC